jgi:alpha-D-xyloside xylohydrolase
LDKLSERVAEKGHEIVTELDALYRSPAIGERVVVDIPAAKGVDVYVFGGPTLLDAVRRYVAFSGGGCLPPLWGLGPWYRCFAGFDQGKALQTAKSLREQKMPFSVFGLEPGWQSAFYPNSFVWSDKFPNPDALVKELDSLGFKLNLWENAFVNPDAAPFAKAIRPFCGDEHSTDGLAPDFLTPEAVELFGGHHAKTFIEKGVSGFKLDECDNSDYGPAPWSFPEYTKFPSGADGEQMHSLYGIKYQECLDGAYKKAGRRHFSLVRSSHALSAPLPFVLYSDLYRHEDFVRGLVNSGFTGHLWTPEVRHAENASELVRRIQAAVLSPCALVNAWYIENPPWSHCGRNTATTRETLRPDAELCGSLVRKALDLRIRLLPYLYTAFARYWRDGVPPFRALIMDWPSDPALRGVDDQFMIGDALMAAPFVVERHSGKTRRLYLPEGGWREFSTGKRLEGKSWLELEDDLETLPLYVKEGSLLPLAEPAETLKEGQPLAVKLTPFGESSASGELYDDDGSSYQFESDGGSWLSFSWSEKSGVKAKSPAKLKTLKLWKISL